MTRLRLEQGRGGGPCDNCEGPGSLETSKDVRRLHICQGCRRLGLSPLKWGRTGRWHVRCLISLLGFAEASKVPGFRERAGICCIGPRRMKRLLDMPRSA